MKAPGQTVPVRNVSASATGTDLRDIVTRAAAAHHLFVAGISVYAAMVFSFMAFRSSFIGFSDHPKRLRTVAWRGENDVLFRFKTAKRRLKDFVRMPVRAGAEGRAE